MYLKTKSTAKCDLCDREDNLFSALTLLFHVEGFSSHHRAIILKTPEQPESHQRPLELSLRTENICVADCVVLASGNLCLTKMRTWAQAVAAVSASGTLYRSTHHRQQSTQLSQHLSSRVWSYRIQESHTVTILSNATEAAYFVKPTLYHLSPASKIWKDSTFNSFWSRKFIIRLSADRVRSSTMISSYILNYGTINVSDVIFYTIHTFT